LFTAVIANETESAQFLVKSNKQRTSAAIDRHKLFLEHNRNKLKYSASAAKLNKQSDKQMNKLFW